MEVFSRQRASTKRIENPEEDLEGWQEINKDDQVKIQRALQGYHIIFSTSLSLFDCISLSPGVVNILVAFSFMYEIVKKILKCVSLVNETGKTHLLLSCYLEK